jgi:hypothetical protein
MRYQGINKHFPKFYDEMKLDELKDEESILANYFNQAETLQHRNELKVRLDDCREHIRKLDDIYQPSFYMGYL